RVTAIAPLSGGACQENFSVAIEEGGHVERLALRSDASTSLTGSISREQEFHAISAATSAGVRTPRAHHLSRGLVREGAWSYFLDWASGEAIGRKVLKNPELEGARQSLHLELAREAAKIHRVTPKSAPALHDAAEWPSARGGVGRKRLATLRASID